jgi:hypothetical protein
MKQAAEVSNPGSPSPQVQAPSPSLPGGAVLHPSTVIVDNTLPLRADLAALTATVTSLAAMVQSLVLAQTAAAANSTVQPLPRLVPPPSSPPPMVSPPADLQPPHRAAVLDRNSAEQTARLTELVSQVTSRSLTEVQEDDTDEEDSRVPLQPHTRSTAIHSLPAQPTVTTRPSPLPEAFIPTLPGSNENNAQLLTSIVNGLAKRETKYKSLTELNEALDDWRERVMPTWSAAQLESLRLYQHLLIFNLGATWTLTKVLEYHRVWCKLVHTGKIDMFAPGAELNQTILFNIEHPLYLGGTTSAAASSTARHGKAKPATTKSAAGTTAPQAGKYEAGSCTNHPSSTTHTTAQCKHPATKK